MEESIEEFKKKMREISSKIKYHDKLGNEIDHDTWAQLCENKNYRIVQQDVVDKYFISTIWLGISHSDLRNPNILEGFNAYFETMVFDNIDKETGGIKEIYRYRSLKDAQEGHEELVNEYKEKKDA